MRKEGLYSTWTEHHLARARRAAALAARMLEGTRTVHVSGEESHAAARGGDGTAARAYALPRRQPQLTAAPSVLLGYVTCRGEG
jgi:hypothetical protein